MCGVSRRTELSDCQTAQSKDMIRRTGDTWRGQDKESGRRAGQPIGGPGRDRLNRDILVLDTEEQVKDFIMESRG